jgi:hypothetical protein
MNLRIRHIQSSSRWKPIIPACAIAAMQLACGHKPLDRATALSLLQNRIIDTVQGSFSSAPGYRGNAIPQYQELVNAGVITCTNSAMMGTVCQAGPNGGGLQDRAGEIAFVAGELVVGSVTAVSQPTPNSAIADLQLIFQPTSIYSRYQAQLNLMDGGSFLQSPLQQRIQGRPARASFQRFDNGWHVMSIQ